MADKLPQHPFVESVKSAPSQPAKKTVVLTGLPGDSDRPDQQRLYLTTKLNYYAEFPVSAILSADQVPADQSPIAGQEATRVTLSRDATIRYVTETSPQPIDEFDLDVRLGALGAAPAILRTGIGPGPEGTCETCRTGCAPCQTEFGTRCVGTCAGHTCVNTQCQQATCVNTQCQQHTCVNTQCDQNTCNTCQTQCNQNTCHTCQTQCNQHTCDTCRTQCNQNTCFDTCIRTCATCCGHPNTCV